MKKIYLIFASLFIMAALNAQSVEQLTGGDMESADAWTVLDVSENDPFVASTDYHEFGYTADGPTDGAGGAYYANASVTGQMISTAVYQKVTINKGEYYIFSMAYKNPMNMVAAWAEAFYSLYEPQENVDWVPAEDSVYKLLGYTGTDWGGSADLYDETASNAVYVPGSGTVDIYIGFKYGCGWADLEYEYTIDNVSLKTLPAAGTGENIIGGNLEAGDAWTVLDVSENDPFVASTDYSEFGYTADGPSDGADGCYYANASVTGQMISTAVYQKVTIKSGEAYNFSMAYKNPMNMVAAWMEAFYSLYEPQENVDWVPAQDSVYKLVGYTGTDWGGSADLYDETSNGIVYVHGNGEDVDIYIGFKYGCGWADLEYEYTIDNVSLIGGATTAINEQTINKVAVYPNPASDYIRVSSVQADEIQIFDLVGKTVFSTRNVSENMSIDISSLAKGAYFLRAGDAVSKFIKN